MYIMDIIIKNAGFKTILIIVLCLIILAMLFLNDKEVEKKEVEKEVVYVQNNPLPLWYYRTGPIWRPPFRRRRRRRFR